MPASEEFRVRDALPDSELAAGLCRGSGELVRLGWGWLTAGDWRTAGQRAGGVALGAAVGVQLAQTYPAVVMPLVTGGWMVGALTLTRTPKHDQAVEHDQAQTEVHDQAVEDDGDPLPSPTDDPGPTRDQLAALIRRVAGQQQGAHHADLLATGELGGWGREDLRAALTEWGIPEGEFKIRDAGGRQRVRVGVRVRDLPTPTGETPSAGPVRLTKSPLSSDKERLSDAMYRTSPPPGDDPHPRVGVGG